MATKCILASAFAFVTSVAASDRHQNAHNKTLQAHAGAASMIVSGITNRDEYCLSVANGAFFCMSVRFRSLVAFLWGLRSAPFLDVLL